MTDRNYKIGLAMWRQTSQYTHNQQVIVRVMRLEDGKDAPCGVGSWYPHEGLPLLDDLVLEAWVSDSLPADGSDPWVNSEQPTYREVHSVHYAKAKAMADLLGKISREVEKQDAREHGDMFAVFAKVVKAEFVCMPKGGGDHSHQLNPRRTSWADTTWTWWKPVEGKRLYRELIREAVDAEKARHGLKVA